MLFRIIFGFFPCRMNVGDIGVTFDQMGKERWHQMGADCSRSPLLTEPIAHGSRSSRSPWLTEKERWHKMGKERWHKMGHQPVRDGARSGEELRADSDPNTLRGAYLELLRRPERNEELFNEYAD